MDTGTEDSKGNIIADKGRVPKIWENYITELYDRTNLPENLQVEPEEGADAYEEFPCVLQSEMETVIENMTDKKAIEGDDVPVDVLKVMGEEGLRILMQLITTYG